MTSYLKDICSVSMDNLPWGFLDGKNILVTGASGLIGSCVVDVLMNRPNINYHVYASGRNIERLKDKFSTYCTLPFFHIIQYDVTETLKADVDFNIIMAGASGASPQLYSTDPVGVMKSNIMGVDNLLAYGIQHDLERFLYISSGEVYGEGDGSEFNENYSGFVNTTLVRSCYPSSKRAAETLCVSYGHQYGIDVRIARPCHVYGPNFTEKDIRVYAQFIRNILNNENIVLKSSGAQFRSWCYVVDCVKALFYILLNGKAGEAYNIADSNSNISIKDLAQMIASLGEKEVVFEKPDEIERQGYNVVSKSVFSTKKIEGLGWSIAGSMKEKMKTTIEECRHRMKLKNH